MGQTNPDAPVMYRRVPSLAFERLQQLADVALLPRHVRLNEEAPGRFQLLQEHGIFVTLECDRATAEFFCELVNDFAESAAKGRISYG